MLRRAEIRSGDLGPDLFHRHCRLWLDLPQGKQHGDNNQQDAADEDGLTKQIRIHEFVWVKTMCVSHGRYLAGEEIGPSAIETAVLGLH